MHPLQGMAARHAINLTYLPAPYTSHPCKALLAHLATVIPKKRQKIKRRHPKTNVRMLGLFHTPSTLSQMTKCHKATHTHTHVESTFLDKGIQQHKTNPNAGRPLFRLLDASCTHVIQQTQESRSWTSTLWDSPLEKPASTKRGGTRNPRLAAPFRCEASLRSLSQVDAGVLFPRRLKLTPTHTDCCVQGRRGTRPGARFFAVDGMGGKRHTDTTTPLCPVTAWKTLGLNPVGPQGRLTAFAGEPPERGWMGEGEDASTPPLNSCLWTREGFPRLSIGLLRV